MKVKKAGLGETTKSPRVQGESSGAFVSTLSCASPTLMFIRQPKCECREDCPAPP